MSDSEESDAAMPSPSASDDEDAGIQQINGQQQQPGPLAQSDWPPRPPPGLPVGETRRRALAWGIAVAHQVLARSDVDLHQQLAARIAAGEIDEGFLGRCLMQRRSSELGSQARALEPAELLLVKTVLAHPPPPEYGWVPELWASYLLPSDFVLFEARDTPPTQASHVVGTKGRTSWSNVTARSDRTPGPGFSMEGDPYGGGRQSRSDTPSSLALPLNGRHRRADGKLFMPQRNLHNLLKIDKVAHLSRLAFSAIFDKKHAAWQARCDAIRAQHEADKGAYAAKAAAAQKRATDHWQELRESGALGRHPGILDVIGAELSRLGDRLLHAVGQRADPVPPPPPLVPPVGSAEWRELYGMPETPPDEPVLPPEPTRTEYWQHDGPLQMTDHTPVVADGRKLAAGAPGVDGFFPPPQPAVTARLMRTTRWVADASQANGGRMEEVSREYVVPDQPRVVQSGRGASIKYSTDEPYIASVLVDDPVAMAKHREAHDHYMGEMKDFKAEKKRVMARNAEKERRRGGWSESDGSDDELLPAEPKAPPPPGKLIGWQTTAPDPKGKRDHFRTGKKTHEAQAKEESKDVRVLTGDWSGKLFVTQAGPLKFDMVSAPTDEALQANFADLEGRAEHMSVTNLRGLLEAANWPSNLTPSAQASKEEVIKAIHGAIKKQRAQQRDRLRIRNIPPNMRSEDDAQRYADLAQIKSRIHAIVVPLSMAALQTQLTLAVAHRDTLYVQQERHTKNVEPYRDMHTAENLSEQLGVCPAERRQIYRHLECKFRPNREPVSDHMRQCVKRWLLTLADASLGTVKPLCFKFKTERIASLAAATDDEGYYVLPDMAVARDVLLFSLQHVGDAQHATISRALVSLHEAADRNAYDTALEDLLQQIRICTDTYLLSSETMPQHLRKFVGGDVNQVELRLQLTGADGLVDRLLREGFTKDVGKLKLMWCEGDPPDLPTDMAQWQGLTRRRTWGFGEPAPADALRIRLDWTIYTSFGLRSVWNKYQREYNFYTEAPVYFANLYRRLGMPDRLRPTAIIQCTDCKKVYDDAREKYDKLNPDGKAKFKFPHVACATRPDVVKADQDWSKGDARYKLCRPCLGKYISEERKTYKSAQVKYQATLALVEQDDPFAEPEALPALKSARDDARTELMLRLRASDAMADRAELWRLENQVKIDKLSSDLERLNSPSATPTKPAKVARLTAEKEKLLAKLATPEPATVVASTPPVMLPDEEARRRIKPQISALRHELIQKKVPGEEVRVQVKALSEQLLATMLRRPEPTPRPHTVPRANPEWVPPLQWRPEDPKGINKGEDWLNPSAADRNGLKPTDWEEKERKIEARRDERVAAAAKRDAATNAVYSPFNAKHSAPAPLPSWESQFAQRLDPKKVARTSAATHRRHLAALTDASNSAMVADHLKDAGDWWVPANDDLRPDGSRRPAGCHNSLGKSPVEYAAMLFTIDALIYERHHMAEPTLVSKWQVPDLGEYWAQFPGMAGFGDGWHRLSEHIDAKGVPIDEGEDERIGELQEPTVCNYNAEHPKVAAQMVGFGIREARATTLSRRPSAPIVLCAFPTVLSDEEQAMEGVLKYKETGDPERHPGETASNYAGRLQKAREDRAEDQARFAAKYRSSLDAAMQDFGDAVETMRDLRAAPAMPTVGPTPVELGRNGLRRRAGKSPLARPAAPVIKDFAYFLKHAMARNCVDMAMRSGAPGQMGWKQEYHATIGCTIADAHQALVEHWLPYFVQRFGDPCPPSQEQVEDGVMPRPPDICFDCWITPMGLHVRKSEDGRYLYTLAMGDTPGNLPMWVPDGARRIYFRDDKSEEDMGVNADPLFAEFGLGGMCGYGDRTAVNDFVTFHCSGGCGRTCSKPRCESEHADIGQAPSRDQDAPRSSALQRSEKQSVLAQIIGDRQIFGGHASDVSAVSSMMNTYLSTSEASVKANCAGKPHLLLLARVGDLLVRMFKNFDNPRWCIVGAGYSSPAAEALRLSLALLQWHAESLMIHAETCRPDCPRIQYSAHRCTLAAACIVMGIRATATQLEGSVDSLYVGYSVPTTEEIVRMCGVAMEWIGTPQILRTSAGASSEAADRMQEMQEAQAQELEEESAQALKDRDEVYKDTLAPGGFADPLVAQARATAHQQRVRADTERRRVEDAEAQEICDALAEDEEHFITDAASGGNDLISDAQQAALARHRVGKPDSSSPEPADEPADRRAPRLSGLLPRNWSLESEDELREARLTPTTSEKEVAASVCRIVKNLVAPPAAAASSSASARTYDEAMKDFEVSLASEEKKCYKRLRDPACSDEYADRMRLIVSAALRDQSINLECNNVHLLFHGLKLVKTVPGAAIRLTSVNDRIKVLKNSLRERQTMHCCTNGCFHTLPYEFGDPPTKLQCECSQKSDADNWTLCTLHSHIPKLQMLPRVTVCQKIVQLSRTSATDGGQAQRKAHFHVLVMDKMPIGTVEPMFLADQTIPEGRLTVTQRIAAESHRADARRQMDRAQGGGGAAQQGEQGQAQVHAAPAQQPRAHSRVAGTRPRQGAEGLPEAARDHRHAVPRGLRRQAPQARADHHD